MKRLLFLFVPLVFFFGCEDDNENDDNSSLTYNCVDNDCFAEEGGQYATLDDCLSVCEESGSNECLLIGQWNLDYVVGVLDFGSEGFRCYCEYTEDSCTEFIDTCMTLDFSENGNLLAQSFSSISGDLVNEISSVWAGSCSEGESFVIVPEEDPIDNVFIQTISNNHLLVVVSDGEGEEYATMSMTR